MGWRRQWTKGSEKEDPFEVLIEFVLFAAANDVARVFVTILIFLALTEELAAWGGVTHQGLTSILISISTYDYEKVEVSSLVRGSVAPDRRQEGWLPPACHGYDPTKEEGTRKRMGLAPKAFAQIINFIRAKNMSRKQRAFEIGRALHLIQDLSQPFHVGSGLFEGRYHARYEKWIDRRADYLVKSARDRAIKASIRKGRPKDVAEELARLTRLDYLELHRLCRKKEWGKELEELTVRCFARAIRYSQYVEVEVCRGKPKKSWQGQIDLLALIIFSVFLHLLVRDKVSVDIQVGC